MLAAQEKKEVKTIDLSKKKAIVTGGLGFIGRNLTRQLLDEGWEVHIIDNCANSKPENLEPGASLNIASITDLPKMVEWFKEVKPDYVFHLAALPRVQFSIQNPVETHEANVTGTMNVLIASKECGSVKKVVYSASSSAYGDQVKKPFRENMKPDPKSPYGAHKYIGEVYCRVWSLVYGLPTVCLRYFNVYGPHQNAEGAYALVVAKFFKLLREKKPFTITGTGKQTRDFTHVFDVVRANILAAEKLSVKDGQVFNIGYGSPVSINRIAELVGGKDYPIEYIEARLEPQDTHADNFAARAVFGWEPKIDIEEGIKMLLESE